MRICRPAALALACAVSILISGCAEAIPGSGTKRALTVTVTQSLPRPVPPLGGHIDSRARSNDEITITGWAEISDSASATLMVVATSSATVVSSYRTIRPDVTTATNDRRLVWSGFSVTVRTTGTKTPPALCITSNDPVFGSRIVIGSDVGSCST